MKATARPNPSKNLVDFPRAESGARLIRPANDDLAPLVERLGGIWLVGVTVAAIACCLLISFAA